MRRIVSRLINTEQTVQDIATLIGGFVALGEEGYYRVGTHNYITSNIEKLMVPRQLIDSAIGGNDVRGILFDDEASYNSNMVNLEIYMKIIDDILYIEMNSGYSYKLIMNIMWKLMENNISGNFVLSNGDGIVYAAIPFETELSAEITNARYIVAINDSSKITDDLYIDQAIKVLHGDIFDLLEYNLGWLPSYFQSFEGKYDMDNMDTYDTLILNEIANGTYAGGSMEEDQTLSTPKYMDNEYSASVLNASLTLLKSLYTVKREG